MNPRVQFCIKTTKPVKILILYHDIFCLLFAGFPLNLPCTETHDEWFWSFHDILFSLVVALLYVRHLTLFNTSFYFGRAEESRHNYRAAIEGNTHHRELSRLSRRRMKDQKRFFQKNWKDEPHWQVYQQLD